MTYRIRTASRLHFGLLRCDFPFGGCGVMVDGWGAEVCVEPAAEFSSSGNCDHRVRQIVERFIQLTGAIRPPACKLTAHNHTPTHSGLGSGSQVNLAISEALLRFFNGGRGQPTDGTRITELADRGHRSRVGTQGYFAGGFISEGVTDSDDERLVMPSAWQPVVFLPKESQPSISGAAEKKVFSQLLPSDPKRHRLLRDLLVNRLIPAVKDHEFMAFASAVYQYNRESGRLFEAVQGGPYNGQQITSLIEELSAEGITGVGQSSWGPGVFAWCNSHSDAEAVCKLGTNGYWRGHIATCSNEPRHIEQSESCAGTDLHCSHQDLNPQT